MLFSCDGEIGQTSVIIESDFEKIALKNGFK